MKPALELRRKPVWKLPLLWLFLLAAGRPALAQLSPGPLAEPHAALEGTSGCRECHSQQKGVDPARCLSCHEALAERIAAGAGLHARAEYADCKTCHIDHHGREFELVWWGEEGMSAFDHTLTGHRLVGRHAGLACRDCHRAEHILEADRLTAVGKDLDRTFLGLGTECLACHRDEHRGQLAEDCTSCHTQDSWLPAAGFDHATTRFPLTGLHRPLGCEACHERVEDPVGDDADYLRFAGVAFQSCSACHADPHSSRFGNRCESCHSTAGWNRVDDARMDHDLTRYPLVGRHREVACESCHRPGAPKRGLRFAACTDCHADEHGGQLASRADGGRCESCHTVEGFTPALYTRDDHDDVFRLVGAHRELECGACHVPVEPAVVAAAPPPDGGELLRFRFASTECQDCHDDPHTGTTDTIAGTIGCLLCHGQVLWEETSFDHGLTGFELLGPHAELACDQCHVRAPGETGEVLEFAGLGVGCESCHESPHGGQFAAADGSVDCLRCHALEAWRPAAGFDHQRDAEFALEGAHARVACESCHRPELVDGVEVVRYKPLPRRCIDCHGG